MPPPVKPYGCVLCPETDPANFYSGYKTLCKKCKPKQTKATRLLLLTPYKCKHCDKEGKENFYPGYKSKCIACVLKEMKAKRSPAKKKILVNE